MLVYYLQIMLTYVEIIMNTITQILHGAGIFTYIYPKNGPGL